jgi:hypothetical protein
MTLIKSQLLRWIKDNRKSKRDKRDHPFTGLPVISHRCARAGQATCRFVTLFTGILTAVRWIILLPGFQNADICRVIEQQKT